MLVNGRSAMVKRAIASYQSQAYVAKPLLVLDSGKTAVKDTPYGECNATTVWMPDMCGATIGALRNAANWCAVDRFNADLIAHWDSDDWSHPRRLAEQVALLEASGKACVGYREVLFWDTRADPNYRERFPAENEKAWREIVEGCAPSRNEAWIYRNPDPRWVCGASMMYRREAWEACPFDDAPGEDRLWWLKNAAKCASVTCFGEYPAFQPLRDNLARMICGIHGQNTEAYSRKDMLSGGNGVWFRAPEWDEYAGRTMKL